MFIEFANFMTLNYDLKEKAKDNIKQVCMERVEEFELYGKEREIKKRNLEERLFKMLLEEVQGQL